MSAAPGSFDFATTGCIRFGRGRAGEAAQLAAARGHRVGLVHGATAARSDWLAHALEAKGCDVCRIKVAGEPSIETLEPALAALGGADCDVIVALGGGSVLDMGKAVAALLPQTGAPLDYLEIVGSGRTLEKDPIPLIAIPTTAGTGSEATRNAVIGVPGAGRKVSLRDRRMLPAVAIVDPALTDGTPAGVTLSCGLDALTQVIEPYLSNRANPITDALCTRAIPLGAAALQRLMTAEDPVARDEMAWVSLCGGIALANAGLGAVHGLAGVLGGVTGAAHGALCGALLPHVLRANADRLEERSEAGNRVAWVNATLARQGAACDCRNGGADALEGWAHRAGLPRLSAMGDPADDFQTIAEAARQSSSMRANPVELSTDELVAILRAASRP